MSQLEALSQWGALNRKEAMSLLVRMRKFRVIIKHSEEVEAQIDRGVDTIWIWKATNSHLRRTSHKRHCVYCGQIFTDSGLSTHVNNFHLRTLKRCNKCGIYFRNS